MREPSHVVMIGASFEARGGLADAMRAYRAAGLFERWPVEHFEAGGGGSLAQRLWQSLWAFAVFLAMLLRHPRAVLHVHSASPIGFWRKCAFMAMAMAARWPVVFHLHGSGFATFYDARCGALGQAAARFFLARAACIVVVSRRWSDWMRRVVRHPHVVTIARPVSLPAPGAAREAHLVAYAGEIAPRRGILDLLQAAVVLKSAFPQIRIECAGEGDLAAVELRAGELGLGAHLRLHGWAGRAARDELLARASVFVMPSHAEAIPDSLLEAMAAGCPVVATCVGGIPDVIRHGVNGLLVPPSNPQALASAVARLLAESTFAAALGRAARETIAQRFSPAEAVERLGRVYAGLGVSGERAPSSYPGHPFPAARRFKESP